MRRRCDCCDLPLADGDCALCDAARLVSPPHPCLRRGELIGDEDGCEPAFPPLAPDHERPAEG